MAEKVEIEIPGIGLIEAKNAATETTLLEILDVLKGTQKDNNKNAKDQKNNSGKGAPPPPGGGGGLNQFAQQAAGASKGLNLLTNAGKAAGVGMNILGRGAGMAAGGIGKLGGGAVMAAGAAFTLGKVAMSAATGITDLIQEMANVGDSTANAAATMRHIPVVGGLLAGVFGAVAAASENVVASYQKSASIGATFGGSVQEMSRAAGGAGMTLDKFAGLIAANGESLMFLGGTTEAGAKQFAGLAKELQGSGVGSELQRLGYTTEQINGGMAKYINIIGRTGALQGMSTQQIVASSGAYLKELDALAKITGVSREAKEQEQAALMADAKVRAAMAGLDADQQKQMMAYITSFPKEQQAAIADMIATGNTTTEEAIQLQSMLPGVAQRTMEFGRTLQAGGKISQDSLNQAKNASILEAQESVKRNKARGMYDEQAGKTFVGMANLASQKVDGYSQAIGEQANATAKANLAENLTKAKQRLSEFSNNFQMALANSGALDGLMDVFSSLANLLMSTVVPVFTNYVVPIILNTVVPALQAVFAIATKIASGLGTLLMPAIDAVAAAFGPGSGLGGTVQFIDGLLNAVFPPLAAIVRGTVMIFEGLLEGIGFLIGPIGRLFDSFSFLEGGTDTLTKILLIAGDYIGTAFKTLGFLLGGVIDVTASVVRWFGDLVSKSEMVSGAFKFIGSAVDMIRTYLSPEGFKAIYASIKEFFTNGISDFIGSFKDAALGMFSGLLQLIGKIPGLGKLADAGKEMEKEIEERKKAREDAAKERKAEINQLHQAAVNQKKERDKKIEQHATGVKQDSKAFSEKKIHLENMGGLNKQEEDEKKKKLEAEQGPTVDMSNPIQMLKTFSAQQKSAFTQEAKALDDKEKARSEMKMASDEYSKAMEARNKAMSSGSAEEKKAAEARLAEAEKRQKAAMENQTKTDEAVTEAKKRMELAKAGKDPGPTKVAEGKPVATGPTASAATGTPTSTGTPAVDKAAVTEGVGNLYQQTQDAINKGIKYGFGSKNLASGAIDCSGWIANINTNMMDSINKEAGKEVYGKEAKKAFQGSAADIIKNVSAAGGGMLEGSKDIRANLKEGMLIGEDNGAKGWDAGRHKGIDHITQAVKDPKTGKLMISESQGGKGVTLTDPEEYFKKKEAKGVKLFGTDMTAMAKGADGRVTAPPSATANVTKPDDAAKARTEAAATDPRRTDRPVAAGEVKKEETPMGSMQSLMKDGIVPTTIAFQELVSKGLKPFQGMLSGMQVNTPLKGEVKPEDSLKKGEEIVKTVAKNLNAGVNALGQNVTMADGTNPETGEKMIAEQSRALQASMTAGAEYMFGGFSQFESSLTGNMLKTFDYFGEDLTSGFDGLISGFSDSFQLVMDDSLGMFNTDLSDNFAAFETLDLPSMVTGLDDYTKQIFAASEEIAKGEAAIAQQEAAIAEASANLVDPSVTNKDEIAAAVASMQDNIQLQKATIAYNKDVIDKNIMARAETPLTELIAQADKDAQEKIRAAEEAAALKASESTKQMAGGQEASGTESIDLNTALAELIAINKRTAELNEKQLSVQSSLSGDLFA